MYPVSPANWRYLSITATFSFGRPGSHWWLIFDTIVTTTMAAVMIDKIRDNVLHTIGTKDESESCAVGRERNKCSLQVASWTHKRVACSRPFWLREQEISRAGDLRSSPAIQCTDSLRLFSKYWYSYYHHYYQSSTSNRNTIIINVNSIILDRHTLAAMGRP
jgi:hypothetical protein